MPFTSIDTLVDRAMKRAGFKKHIETAIALERATKIIRTILGDDTDQTIRPAYVRYKILTIACIDSSAAASIGMIQDDILEYVNAGYPQKIAERIGVIT